MGAPSVEEDWLELLKAEFCILILNGINSFLIKAFNENFIDLKRYSTGLN